MKLKIAVLIICALMGVWLGLAMGVLWLGIVLSLMAGFWAISGED